MEARISFDPMVLPPFLGGIVAMELHISGSVLAGAEVTMGCTRLLVVLARMLHP